MYMKGFEIKFNIYADSEEEARKAETAIKGFISEHAKHGRAVTGEKISKAVGSWQANPFVKSQIINYFS